MKNKKGFTLAELLIVVAIIAVLVAISIPIFNAQLRKARIATNKANIRAAKAAAVTQYYDDSFEMSDIGSNLNGVYYEYDVKTGTIKRRSDFNNYNAADVAGRELTDKAANYEVVETVYVYIGESDKPGRTGEGISVETAPYYVGDEVGSVGQTNPYGWSE